ncbi:MAG: sugar ABC transporter substrate-binding protein [Thermomicrobiales bacterium]
MNDPMQSKLQRRTLLKTVPAAGLATLMRPEGSLGADAVRFAFFADPSEAMAYAQLIDRFEDVQDEIKIEPVVISSSNVAPLGRLLPASKYPEWLRSSFTGPNPPDVFLFTYRDAGVYDTRGVLEPLDTWLADSRSLSESDFYPEALALFRPMNKPLMAIPQNLSSLVVYFNTEMFESARLDDPSTGWSWDVFTAAAEKLTRDTDGDGFPEVHGVAFDPTIHRFAAGVWGAGGELFDDVYQPTKLTLDTPEARTGIEFITNLGPNGIGATPTQADRMLLDDTQRFLRGQSAMLIQSRRVVAYLRDNAEVPWDVAPLPVGLVPANVSHSDGIGIWSGSPRKDGAWKFLEFAMGEEGQKILAESGRTVPSMKRVAESDAFLKGGSAASLLGYAQSPRSASVYLDNIAISRPLPSTSTWPSAVWEMDRAFKKAFYDDGDVDAAITQVMERTTFSNESSSDLFQMASPNRIPGTED